MAAAASIGVKILSNLWVSLDGRLLRISIHLGEIAGGTHERERYYRHPDVDTDDCAGWRQR
ncbi:hypothetical protein BN1007_100164 [Klebsiella variicola]|nr:hypothetical protein BN1007_100164 [Klebsiella variicola]